MLREQLPNLFRLYLNPYVAADVLLPGPLRPDHVAAREATPTSYQTFLANGFDEALSGAIKLARYCASMAGRPATGLIDRPGDRLGPFVGAAGGRRGAGRVSAGPAIVGQTTGGPRERSRRRIKRFGFVVLVRTNRWTRRACAESIRTSDSRATLRC